MYGYNSYPSPVGYQMQANQNRINELQNTYGTYPMYQTQPIQPTQTQVIKGRPVSGYEEAKASMIDLDGSLFVFPDISNRKIYTKRILLDGTPEFHTYSLDMGEIPKQAQTGNPQHAEYVLRQDFENTVQQLVKEIQQLKEGAWDATEQNTGDGKSRNAKQSNV